MKRIRGMKLSDALWDAVRARAVSDGVSATFVVETSLARHLGLAALAPREDTQLRTMSPQLRDQPTVPVEPTCGRCGHPVRKHDPQCYVMGCACRAVS